MNFERLEDICDIQSGLWKGKKEPFVKVLVVRNTNFRASGQLNYDNVAMLDVEEKQFVKRQLEFGDIILEKSGGGDKTPVGRVCLFEREENNFSLSNFTAFLRVKSKDKVYYRYLHYYLHMLYVNGRTEAMQRHSTGIRNLQLTQYRNISVPLPPLAEQQRIVVKLDAAFAEIDRAIKYTEKAAIQNSMLYTSSVTQVIKSHSTDIVSISIGELLKLSSGNFLPSKSMIQDGEVDVYGGNGVAGKHNKNNLSGENILIGRVGAKCGNVHYVDKAIWLTDNAMYAHSFTRDVHLPFLSIILDSLSLGKYARQAAQPVISFSSVKDVKMVIPTKVKEQIRISSILLETELGIQKHAVYQKKKLEQYSLLKSAILAQELQSEAA